MSTRLSSSFAYGLQLKAELSQVLRAFSEHNIPCIVLKGLPLAEELYGGLSERAMCDNDVVVRLGDVQRANNVLVSLGFRDAQRQSLSTSLATNFQHPMSRDLPQLGPSLFELHWHAFPPYYFQTDEALLFTNTRPVFVGQVEARVLSYELGILHLVSHYLQHTLGEPRILCDLGRAWDRWGPLADQNTLSTLAKRIGARVALDFCLRATHRAGLCEREVPKTLHTRRGSWLLSLLSKGELASGDQKPDLKRTLYTWAALDRHHATRSALRELFPSHNRMSAIHPDDGAVRLLLRFAERPARGLFKRIGQRRW